MNQNGDNEITRHNRHLYASPDPIILYHTRWEQNKRNREIKTKQQKIMIEKSGCTRRPITLYHTYDHSATVTFAHKFIYIFISKQNGWCHQISLCIKNKYGELADSTQIALRQLMWFSLHFLFRLKLSKQKLRIHKCEKRKKKKYLWFECMRLMVFMGIGCVCVCDCELP